MRYCKKCVMPDTRPGIKFNDSGICSPCMNAEMKLETDWESRLSYLYDIGDKYRSSTGDYDCVIPASGGKDSWFQTYIAKEKLKLNPLIVCVGDSFTHTKTGIENLNKMSDVFGVDILRYNLNHNTMRKMTTLSFKYFGSPNWAVDLAIYTIPLKIAFSMGIKLIIYGENVAYEYGGPNTRETYSAKEQILNDVVKPIDWSWWLSHGITKEEISMIQYPSNVVLNYIDPIYLSYFIKWDGKSNYEFAKSRGFKSLESEWNRKGFIEQYDQIDSIGYLLHPQLKYQKFGHARATDVASCWIRNNYISREEGIELVKNNDHILDERIVDDFIDFTHISRSEFNKTLHSLYNKEIFEYKNKKWVLKHPIWKE